MQSGIVNVTWIFRSPVTKVLFIYCAIQMKMSFIVHYDYCIFILFQDHLHSHSKVHLLRVISHIELLNNLHFVWMES